MDRCPHCNTALTGDAVNVDMFVERLARDGHAVYKGRRIALSQMQQTVFKTLAAKKGKVVSSDHIINELYALARDGGPDDALATLKVRISHIRAKLPPEVSISSQWGTGYYLSYGGPETYVHPNHYLKTNPFKYVRKRVA